MMQTGAPSLLLPLSTGRGIAYASAGRGPTLLAVHGGPGMDHGFFRPFLDPLADDLRLVFFDLPGHGQSGPLADERLSAMAESIEDVRTALGAPTIALLGSSYGGFLALTYALAHPGAVSALVLVDTSASFGFRQESLEIAERRATPAMLASLRRLWDGSLADDAAFARAWRDIFPLYFHRLPPAEIDALARQCSYSLATRRRILPTLQSYDLRDRLGEIEAPALVIVGRHDWITSVRQAEELVAGLRRAELVVFEESGHYPFIEEQGWFLSVVREWLTGLPGIEMPG
jgi:proline iminopeptidase